MINKIIISVYKRFLNFLRALLTANLMELINECFEILDFVMNFLLSRARPCFGFSTKFLETMAENTLLLFIEIKAFRVALFINLTDDIFDVRFDIIYHLINLPDGLKNLSFFDFTDLNCIVT